MRLLTTAVFLSLTLSSPLSLPPTPLNLLTNRAPATCGICNPNPPKQRQKLHSSVCHHRYSHLLRLPRRLPRNHGDTSVQWWLPTQGQAGRVLSDPVFCSKTSLRGRRPALYIEDCLENEDADEESAYRWLVIRFVTSGSLGTMGVGRWGWWLIALEDEAGFDGEG